MIVAQAVALRALVRFLSYWCYKSDLLKSFGRRFLKILRRCTCSSRISSCIRTCLLSLYFNINCAVRLSGCCHDQISLSWVRSKLSCAWKVRASKLRRRQLGLIDLLGWLQIQRSSHSGSIGLCQSSLTWLTTFTVRYNVKFTFLLRYCVLGAVDILESLAARSYCIRKAYSPWDRSRYY